MIRQYKAKDVEPYPPCCVDLETAPDGTVIAVGFVYDNTYTAYDTLGAWWKEYKELMKIKKEYRRIYAHNGANFDYLCIYEYLMVNEKLEVCDYFISDSSGIGVKIKVDGVSITLLDSYRMLPAALGDKEDENGKIIKGLTSTFKVDNPKQSVPDDCKDDYLRFKERYPELFWEYLRNDVLGLQQVLYKFWTMIVDLYGNVGSLPMTLPSLSLRLWTKTLSDVLMTPYNAKLKELEREAYKGGLTLCMNTGVFNNVNVYDVNSMYPAQMIDCEFPSSYIGYWTQEYDKVAMGLWRGRFTQGRHDLPPILFDKSGAVYAGEGAYTTDEINYLLEIGGTFELVEGYVFERKQKLFSDFIGKAYSLRLVAQKEGNEALAFTLKIFMNSLYGKFGQREEGWTLKMITGAEQDELLDNKVEFKCYGDISAVKEHRVVPHAFVSIAAYVTARARISLHRSICALIDAGNDVFYCDTDSIHTNGVLETSSALGAMKLEFQGEATYAGRKLYSLRKTDEMGHKKVKVKAKGVGRNIRMGTLNYSTITRLAMDKDESEEITFTTAPTVKEVMAKKRRSGEFASKSRKIRNTGGIWDDSG